VRELNHLGRAFGKLVHLAPLHAGEPPASSLPYSDRETEFIPVMPAGGKHVIDKLEILIRTPHYLNKILRQLNLADVVQVRCPANISLIALITLIFVRKPRLRWFKYAGNWQPEPGLDVLSSWLHRWILQNNWARGPVTINGKWADQPRHIFTFVNPCISEVELSRARQFMHEKTLTSPVRLLFVGRIEPEKDLGKAIRAVSLLQQRGVELVFDIVGDGDKRFQYKHVADALGLTDRVYFHGWVPREQLDRYYMNAHLLLLTSNTEGWPKVAGEAMAFGVVPVASSISSIPQILGEIGCGVAVPFSSEKAFADAIQAYLVDPGRWQLESQRGREAVERFTYESYLKALDCVFQNSWGRSIWKMSDHEPTR
jgi:glycosyltransferase involved in cell wall biosynthesis